MEVLGFVVQQLRRVDSVAVFQLEEAPTIVTEIPSRARVVVGRNVRIKGAERPNVASDWSVFLDAPRIQPYALWWIVNVGETVMV